MEEKGTLERIREWAKRGRGAARGLAIAAFCVAMLGFLGSGYCEHEARFSPAAPDYANNYTNDVYFKGVTRYVNDFDKNVCTVSKPLAFFGISVCLVIGGFYYSIIGRLP